MAARKSRASMRWPRSTSGRMLVAAATIAEATDVRAAGTRARAGAPEPVNMGLGLSDRG